MKNILKSETKKLKFIINISYYINNHYQIILDKEEVLSLWIVLFYQNMFQQEINKISKNVHLKNYGDNTIPYLKKYNLINISKISFKCIILFIPIK